MKILKKYAGPLGMRAILEIDVTDSRRNCSNGAECIFCMECAENCPKGAIKF